MDEDYVKRMQNGEMLVSALFTGPHAEDCLEFLRDDLGMVPIKRTDPLETYFRLGQASVLAKLSGGET